MVDGKCFILPGCWWLKLLVLSDLHGNIEALKTVVEEARGWSDVIVLGDLVDYGPWPGEVVDYVRELGVHAIRGNHDHAVGYGVDCRCSEETHWLSVWFRENITLKMLSRNDREWLARLPLSLEVELDGVKITAVHGSPQNPLYGYLYPWLGVDELCRALKTSSKFSFKTGVASCPDKGLFLVGHTHIQFTLSIEGARIINPGSVGEPRDGISSAAYAIIDTETQAVTLKRTRYNVDKVVKALESLRIPEPYIGALKHMFIKAKTPPRPIRLRK